MIKNLGIIDIGVVALYVIFFCGLCVHASKKVNSSKDFSNAGRNLPWIMVAGSTIATTMGGGMVIGKYDLIYESGLSGITAGLFWYVGWIFLLIMAKPLYRSGAVSIPSYLELRYNEATRKIASYCVLVSAVSSCAATFLSIGTILEALGICSRQTGTFIGALIVVLMTIFGGLWGVALTDTIQAVIIMITFGIIFPVMVFHTAGGIDAVIAVNGPERLDLFTGIAPVSMVGWFISYTLSTGAEPSFALRIFSAKSEKDALIGQVIAWGFSLVVAGVIVALPALAIQNIFPELTVGSQFAVKYIAAYFPVALKGLIFAILLGVMLTSGDSYLLLLSSTFLEDIVRPRRKDISERAALRTVRLSCIVSSVLLCVMALHVDKIYQLFKTGGGAYGAGVFFPLILGCFWKRMNAKAAGVAMLAGCFTSFIFDMAVKIPFSLNIDGCIIGAALCLCICVFGSLWAERQEKMGGISSKAGI